MRVSWLKSSSILLATPPSTWLPDAFSESTKTLLMTLAVLYLISIFLGSIVAASTKEEFKDIKVHNSSKLFAGMAVMVPALYFVEFPVLDMVIPWQSQSAFFEHWLWGVPLLILATRMILEGLYGPAKKESDNIDAA